MIDSPLGITQATGEKNDIITKRQLFRKKKKRLYPRKILESSPIRGNRRICTNLNDGLVLSTQYGKGKDAWPSRRSQLRRERDCHKCTT